MVEGHGDVASFARMGHIGVLRIGVGRLNTGGEVETAVDKIIVTVPQLQELNQAMVMGVS
ncbi:MAG: hypothetical protein ACE5FD_14460 [Anaerolineae bacterium]